MVEPWQAAILVLAGAAIPLAVQGWITLRGLNEAARRLTGRGAEALEAVTAASQRLDGLVAKLDAEGRVERLAEGVDALTRGALELRESLRVASAVGAAVGPAVGAAVRAWRSTDGAARGDRGVNGVEDPRREEMDG